MNPWIRGACLAVLLSNCGETVCTAIGCDDGLSVVVQNAPTSPFRIEVYVSNVAPRYVKTCPAVPCDVFFPDFTPDMVHISVIAGTDTMTHDFYPAYAVTRPNGPHCSTECRQARVTFVP